MPSRRKTACESKDTSIIEVPSPPEAPGWVTDDEDWEDGWREGFKRGYSSKQTARTSSHVSLSPVEFIELCNNALLSGTDLESIHEELLDESKRLERSLRCLQQACTVLRAGDIAVPYADHAQKLSEDVTPKLCDVLARLDIVRIFMAQDADQTPV